MQSTFVHDNLSEYVSGSIETWCMENFPGLNFYCSIFKGFMTEKERQCAYTKALVKVK